MYTLDVALEDGVAGVDPVRMRSTLEVLRVQILSLQPALSLSSRAALYRDYLM